ncbi:hypothetical protein [Brevundimonas faecalis]|uniref:Uncharacterized protein n=1 Tax=Brevundimonas faecalis TaxID=947378 RepID=A0ABV2RAQ2_9CAUL
MSEKSDLPRDAAFNADLKRLEAELAAKPNQSPPGPDIPTQTVDLITGLLAGMRFVGRARDVHTAAERLAHESTHLPR